MELRTNATMKRTFEKIIIVVFGMLSALCFLAYFAGL